jgi:hypothetical protein
MVCSSYINLRKIPKSALLYLLTLLKSENQTHHLERDTPLRRLRGIENKLRAYYSKIRDDAK